MKTYNERLNDLATEFAKAECARIGVIIGDTSMVDVVNNFKPLAAIALKHMAEMYKKGRLDEGYEWINFDMNAKLSEKDCLISLGLEPQTT